MLVVRVTAVGIFKDTFPSISVAATPQKLGFVFFQEEDPLKLDRLSMIVVNTTGILSQSCYDLPTGDSKAATASGVD